MIATRLVLLVDRNHAQRHREGAVTRSPGCHSRSMRRPIACHAVDRECCIVDRRPTSLAPAGDPQTESEAERAFKRQRQVGRLRFGIAGFLAQA